MSVVSRKLLRAARRAAPAIPYKWQRSQFRSGDVFCQSHGDWASWKGIKVLGVRAVTLSTYSHCGVIDVDPTDGRVYAIEAVQPCAHRVLLSEIGSFYYLPMQATWNSATSVYVRSILGTFYSQWDAIKAYFRPLPDGTVTECAALTREVLERAGVDLGPMSRPDAVVQACLAHGSALTFIVNEGKQ
jgi:hypothetical protein